MVMGETAIALKYRFVAPLQPDLGIKVLNYKVLIKKTKVLKTRAPS